MESFWDTSAVMKLYVDEPDAGPFRRLAQGPGSLLISAFTVHELHCGLHRKERLKALKPGMAEVLFEAFRHEMKAEFFRTIIYDGRVEQHALEVVQRCYVAEKAVFLRVLDALQLASALTAGASDIVSTDTRMRRGATLLGMKVFPRPNS
jgi:uncharacterized protein with PIN domain